MIAQVVKRPVITEKSLQLAAVQNAYTFVVDRTASKTQIKYAVETLYGVKVESVNTSRHYRVKVRTGKKRMPVMLAPTKKAVVTLKKGDKIDLFDFGGQE